MTSPIAAGGRGLPGLQPGHDGAPPSARRADCDSTSRRPRWPSEMVRGQARAAPPAVTRGGAQGGDGLGGDEPVLGGELVDDGEGRGDPLRGCRSRSVTTGTWRPSCRTRSPWGAWSPWNPQIPRSVVAPLIPAERSRRTMARCTGWPPCWAASELKIMSLLPERHAVLVGARQRAGRGEQLPVTLAHLDPFERDQRAAQQRAQLGQHLPDPVRRNPPRPPSSAPRRCG